MKNINDISFRNENSRIKSLPDKTSITSIQKGAYLIVKISTKSKKIAFFLPVSKFYIEDCSKVYVFIYFSPKILTKQETEVIIFNILQLQSKIQVSTKTLLQRSSLQFTDISINSTQTNIKIQAQFKTVNHWWIQELNLANQCQRQTKLKIVQGTTQSSLQYSVELEKISSVFQAINDLENSVTNYAYFDRRVLRMIFWELGMRKKRSIFLETHIEMLERSNKSTHFQNSKVILTVTNSSICVTAMIEPEKRESINLNPQIVHRLQSYFHSLNPVLSSGGFYINMQLNKICFSTKFLALTPFYQNKHTYLFIKTILNSFYSHVDSIYAVCTSQSPTLPRLILVKPSPNLLKRVVLELSEKSLQKEQKIKQILTNPQECFLDKRLSLSHITFKDAQVSYAVPVQGEGFQSIFQTIPVEAINSVTELIKELEGRGIYLKNCTFPIKYFFWVDNKPIYSYPSPLCEFLTTKKPCEQYYDKVIDELLSLFHEISNLIGNKRIFSDFKTANMRPGLVLVEIHRDLALKRLELSRKCDNEIFVKYLEILAGQSKCYLLCSQHITPNLYSSLEDLEVIHLYRLLLQLLQGIAEVQLKNSVFTSFDMQCLILTKDSGLKLVLKCPEEVTVDFLAPEVRKGRVHKTSAMFSFGKVFECCIIRYLELSNRPDPYRFTNHNVEFSDIQFCFPQAIDILEGCLIENPLKRLNCSQVIEKLIKSFN